MSKTDSAQVHLPAPALTTAASAYDRLAELLLFMPIIGVTFLQKVAIPLGSYQVPIGTGIIAAATGIGLLLGRMRLIGVNLIFYTAMLVVLGSFQIFASEYISWKSFALLVVVHASYVVFLEPGSTRVHIQLRFYQNVMAIVAICGIAQFFLQFVTSSPYVFPIENYLPTKILLRGFNNMIPLSYNGSIYKSNGVFLVEPSTLSEYSAISFTIELLYYRRILRLALLAAAMIVSFSGTGIVILGCLLPPILIAYRRFELIILMIGIAVLIYLASDALHLDIFVRRATEFDDPTSSGFARYIGPLYVLDQYLTPDVSHMMFGLGAGSFGHIGTPHEFANPVTWAKMPFEYGLIGAGVYFAFIGYCIYSTRQSVFLCSVLALALLLFGPLIPFIHALIFTLLVWPFGGKGKSLEEPALRVPSQ